MCCDESSFLRVKSSRESSHPDGNHVDQLAVVHRRLNYTVVFSRAQSPIAPCLACLYVARFFRQYIKNVCITQNSYMQCGSEISTAAKCSTAEHIISCKIIHKSELTPHTEFSPHTHHTSDDEQQQQKHDDDDDDIMQS